MQKLIVMNELFFIHKRTLTFLLFLSLLSVSCRKLISIPPNPPSEIPQTQVFADSADIQAAVAGIYANFKTSGASASWVNGAITISGGLSADEILGTSSYDQLAPQFYKNAVLIDNSTVATMWKQAYLDLYQMNVCLEGIAGTTAISDSLKRLLTGQIKVVRALYYFNMVNLWGGVPVVTSSDYAANANLPRATADSVYSRIKADLMDATTLLPVQYLSAGRSRPNLYTAEALLAKVYLYRQDWDNAAIMAGNVINSGVYSLETNPNNVFLHGSNEAIWQLPATGQNYQTVEGYTFNLGYSRTPGYVMTSFLLNAFETGDLRKTDWIGSSVNLGTTYYYPHKYKNRAATATPVEDYMVLRLGELYLILAEALAQKNQLNDAVTSLNTVRSRAGLAGSTAATQTDVLNAILHERQTELFCEWGNRWYDLKRTGTVDAVLGPEKPGIWQPYAALYPVPKAEILTNSFLIQNTGY
jgi:starch-binding outer membrane protein, SusD/RagB family